MVGWVSGWVLEGLGGDRGHFWCKPIVTLGGLPLVIVNAKECGARKGLCGKPYFRRGGLFGWIGPGGERGASEMRVRLTGRTFRTSRVGGLEEAALGMGGVCRVGLFGRVGCGEAWLGSAGGWD